MNILYYYKFFLFSLFNIKMLDVWIELLLFVIVGIMDC